MTTELYSVGKPQYLTCIYYKVCNIANPSTT